MSTCRSFLRLVRETFDELRLDFEEIIELVFEQIGLEEVWTRANARTNAFLQYLRPNDLNKGGGRRRSLIRLIGSRLRLKPAKRMQIRVLEAIREDGERREEASQVEIGLQGLLIDDRNLLNDHIKHRWSVGNEERPFLDGEDDDCSEEKRVTSTPKKRAFEEGRNEVVSLHAELERLRLQIASIVSIQECAIKKRTKAPPPPPPPLPPIALFAPHLDKRILSVHAFERVSNGIRSQTTTNRVNLTEVLKDIGNVKLRKTDRSPGGTPLRRKAKFEADENDPAVIMASALKKRFAHHLQALQESLEKENVDTDPDDSVWDTSSSFTSPVKCLSPPSVRNNDLHCKSFGVAY